MLSRVVVASLKKNWGSKADALDCYAEVKFIDPLSSWCCYIFAMDRNEEIVHCLAYSDTMGVEIYTESMQNIQAMYNEEGEHPVPDKEFRRTRVSEILSRLNHDT
jgi:hypothetical protein